MEAFVADRAAILMEAVDYSSNSKLPAILIILPNDYHLLKKQRHVMLPRGRMKPSSGLPKKSTEQKKNCQIDR